MTKLPENIPFETAFIAVFGGEIERRGGDLAEAAQCFYPGADLDDYDPDQIRDDLSEAITEAAATLGFTFPTPAGPALDQLYEMALDSFGPLRDYIDATTDHTEPDLDAWRQNPYTKALMKSIAEDYVPKHVRPTAVSAPVEAPADEFNGDTPHLIRCIESLLRLDAAGALVPHGVGGHARTMLAAAAKRLAQQPAAVDDAMVERAVAAYAAGPWMSFSPEESRETNRDRMRAALTAALAQQPAAEAQPVAWDVFDKEGNLIAGRVSKADADDIASRWEYEGSRISPLYAHPPPSAPVGVEAMPGLRRELSGIVRRGDEGMVSIEPNEAAAILAALAQQPAAVDEEMQEEGK